MIQSSSFKGIEELDGVKCAFIPLPLRRGSENLVQFLNQNPSIFSLNDFIDRYHVFVSTEFATVS